MIQSNFKKYTLEADVDDYVKVVLSALGLKKGVDYNEKSAMSDYMKEALKGAAKTKSKKLFGIPDFHLESRKIPVVIENKLGNKYHISANKSGIKMDENSIKNYAVNGAVYYAKNMIESKKYDEVIAIGISGEDSESIKISTYYVFSSYIEPKYMKNYSSLGFLESKKSFDAFYEDATVTEDEKHRILIKTREELLRHAKNLNLTSTKSIDMLKKKEKQLYPVSEVFDIYKIPSYNKEHLTIPDNSDEVYDYITRTTTDRGICEKTGFIDSEGMNEAGTFSLGLLSMVFYYRENDWYAGQFMRKISCKYKIDRWTAIYLETVLNGLSEKLLSGLVRDVDSTFLDLKIELPSKDGEIDFEWISNYVKSREKQVIGDMIQAFTQEQED